MIDKDKPRAIANISIQGAPKQTGVPLLRPQPMRTQEELTPLALRIIENAELMQQFRAVMGSEDKERAEAVVDEITKYAQTLDPTINVSEGIRIVLNLMRIVGHPNGEAS